MHPKGTTIQGLPRVWLSGNSASPVFVVCHGTFSSQTWEENHLPVLQPLSPLWNLASFLGLCWDHAPSEAIWVTPSHQSTL